MAELGIPLERINQDIRIIVIPDMNTFKLDDSVDMFVDVTADATFQFPPGFGPRIFINEQGKWRELTNYVEYNEGDVTLSKSNGKLFNMGNTGVMLKPDEVNGPVALRIVIVGHRIINNEVSDQTSTSYVDVKLHP